MATFLGVHNLKFMSKIKYGIQCEIRKRNQVFDQNMYCACMYMYITCVCFSFHSLAHFTDMFRKVEESSHNKSSCVNFCPVDGYYSTNNIISQKSYVFYRSLTLMFELRHEQT